MSDDPIVFVVDDDQDMRNSLRWLLESVSLTVQTFASAEQFLEEYLPGQPGCLLLDVRMPGIGGLRLLERLQQTRQGLPIILFTGHGDVPMAVQALKSGAFDFIEKPATHQRILDRVQDALVADRLLRAQREKLQTFENLLAQLSNREREVLDRLVEGDSNKMIASELGISERTVEKHRESVMQKMGERSLARLIRLYVIYQRDSGQC